MRTEEQKIEEVLRLTAEVWNKYLELEEHEKFWKVIENVCKF